MQVVRGELRLTTQMGASSPDAIPQLKRYMMPTVLQLGSAQSVTTLPGTSGVPRWSVEPCHHTLLHPRT